MSRTDEIPFGTFVYVVLDTVYGVIESSEADDEYQVLDLQELRTKRVHKNVLRVIEDESVIQEARSLYDEYSENRAKFYDSLFSKSLAPEEIEGGLFIPTYHHKLSINKSNYDEVERQEIHDNINNGDDDNEGDLKTVYKKMRFWTIIIMILCLISFIGAIISGFYTWRGITFNCIVIIAALFGLYSVSCIDDTKYSIKKLKYLLIYFVITLILIIIILIVLIVYAIILPLRNYGDYSTLTFVTATIFFLFTILFWSVFVMFYIDLTARCCLKRGRINYTINNVIKLHHNDNNTKCIWHKLYYLVLIYRQNFRKLRKCITRFTCLRCIYDKKDFDQSKNFKEMEGERVIVMLEEGQINMNKQQFVTKCSKQCGNACSNCLYVLIFPFICCWKGILKIAQSMMKCCGQCIVTIFDCSRCDAIDGDICIKCCCPMICLLILMYLFVPFVIMMIIFGILAAITLPVLYCCLNEAGDEHDVLIQIAFYCLGCCCLIIGGSVWGLLWYQLMCPIQEWDEIEDDGKWSWEKQCFLWNFAMEILDALSGG